MLEYCWTKRRCHEEDEAPGPGWQYYGGCIKGSIDDPVNLWAVTRWAKPEGVTETFNPTIVLCAPTLAPLDAYHKVKGKDHAMSLLKPKNFFSVPKKVGIDPACVTPLVTVTPSVTPPEPTTKPKGLAWALHLLKT